MLRAPRRSTKTKTRRAIVNARQAGPEPKITPTSPTIDLIHAYNFYNTYYDADDGKKFVLAYLKKIKKTDLIKKVQQVPAIELRNIGWNFRILTNGGKLPEAVAASILKKLNGIISKVQPEKEEQPEVVVPEVSIQDRIDNKASLLISLLEDNLDLYYTEKKTFDASAWFREQAVKPALAKRISEYYAPLYAEIYDALQKKDPQLTEAYSRYSKPELKKYLELVKSILSAAEVATVVAKATRKPRKKKEKPASVLVSKLKYLDKDESVAATSIDPQNIIGAEQLWVFNTKNRVLSVYNAIGPSGLGVKGTTITGFDEKTSIGKKLRKPLECVEKVLSGGKLVLRKVLDDVKAKEKPANGRINSMVVLLRAVKK